MKTRHDHSQVFFHNSSFIIHTFLLFTFYSICRADVLILTDGTRLEGKSHKDGDHWVIVDSSGHQTSVDPEQIKSFSIGSGGQSPQQRLAELRTTAEGMSDASVVIERYNAFLKSTATGPEAEQAKADLALWQQRATEGYLKVGPHWLTPAQNEALVAAEAATAQQAADLLRRGHAPEAAKILKQALADDPNNPAALYLNSLLLAQQNQNVAARAALEQLNKQIPDHGPTLNNLAVVYWRQRIYVAAVNDYAQAMTADPNNKTILDNTAEALHALPDENRAAPQAAQAHALFTEQDLTLQQSQKSLGFSRWGAMWVSSDQLPKLEVEEQTMNGQLAEIQADFDSTHASVASDDAQIQTTQQAINNGANQTPLPQNYYQLQQDLTLLTAARTVGQDHLKELQLRYDRVQKSLSVPKFSGVQRLIGAEGTPIRIGTPATKPAVSAP